MKVYIIKDESIQKLIKEYYNKRQNQQRSILDYSMGNILDLFTIVFNKQENKDEVAILESISDYKEVLLLLLRDNLLTSVKEDFLIAPEMYIKKILEEKELDENNYIIKYEPDTKITSSMILGLAVIRKFVESERRNNVKDVNLYDISYNVYEILRKLVLKLSNNALSITVMDLQLIFSIINSISVNFDREKMEGISRIISNIKESLNLSDHEEIRDRLSKIHDLILDLEDIERVERSVEDPEELEKTLRRYIDVKVYRDGTIKIIVKDKLSYIIQTKAVDEFLRSYEEYKKAKNMGFQNKKGFNRTIKIKHFLDLNKLFRLLSEINYDFHDEKVRRIIDNILKKRGDIVLTKERINYSDFEKYLIKIEMFIANMSLLLTDKDSIVFESAREEDSIYTLLNYFKDMYHKTYIYYAKDLSNPLREIKDVISSDFEKHVIFYIQRKSNNEEKTYLILNTKFFNSFDVSVTKWAVYRFLSREQLIKKTLIIAKKDGQDKYVGYIIDLDKLLEKLKINKEEYMKIIKDKSQSISSIKEMDKLEGNLGSFDTNEMSEI